MPAGVCPTCALLKNIPNCCLGLYDHALIRKLRTVLSKGVGLMCWNKGLGVLIVIGLLTACGNKGPLVMPDAASGQGAEKVKQELAN